MRSLPLIVFFVGVTARFSQGASVTTGFGRRLTDLAEVSMQEIDEEPVDPDEPCFRCPGHQIIYVPFEGIDYSRVPKPVVLRCDKKNIKDPIRIKIVSGPKPGAYARKGVHIIHFMIYEKLVPVKLCRYVLRVRVPSCNTLPVGKHLVTNCTNDKNWGSVCNFDCELGYRIVGPRKTVCEGMIRSQLGWTYPIPDCIPIDGCLLPEIPQGMKLNCSDDDGSGVYEDNAICRISCDKGYSLKPSLISRTTCFRGGWSNLDIASCVKDVEPAEEEKCTCSSTTTPSLLEEEETQESALQSPTILRTNLNFTVEILGSCGEDAELEENYVVQAVKDELIQRNQDECDRMSCNTWKFTCAPDASSAADSGLVHVQWTLQADFSPHASDPEDVGAVEIEDVEGYDAEMMLQQVQVNVEKLMSDESLGFLPHVDVMGGRVVPSSFRLGPIVLSCAMPGSEVDAETDSCRPCQPGHFMGTDACLPCPENTYQPLLGSNTCHRCPDGTRSPAATADILSCKSTDDL